MNYNSKSKFNFSYNVIENYKATTDVINNFIVLYKATLANNSQHLNQNFVHLANSYLTFTERFTKRYEKQAFNISECEVKGKKYKVKEEIKLKKTFCNLIHFKKLEIQENLPKLLIIAPISGHHSTLLRATVSEMLKTCDVYLTDWINARDIEKEAGNFDLDDSIDYLIEFMDLLSPNLHTMAVCQPTVPLLAAVAIMSHEKSKNVPKSMVLIGGPIDARKNPTRVDQLAISKNIEWFDNFMISKVPSNYKGAGRKVYPGFLQVASFVNMNVMNHVNSHLDFFNSLLEKDTKKSEKIASFYDEYFATMDMTAEFYLQTIAEVFRDFDLPRGKFESRGRHVHLSHITDVAIFGIEGERDDVAAVGQTKAALQLCKNVVPEKKKYHLQKDVGHYGLFSGGKFKEEIAPLITSFICQNNKLPESKVPENKIQNSKIEDKTE